MSWHNPAVGATSRSPDSTSCHAPGPVFWTQGSPQPRLLSPVSNVLTGNGNAEPLLATCGLCPEPGLVPASLMSGHMLKEHPGMAFECAACKVKSPNVLMSFLYLPWEREMSIFTTTFTD